MTPRSFKSGSALLLSSNPVDTEFAKEFLADCGIEAHAYSRVAQLVAAMDERSGCLVLIEDALIAEELPALCAKLDEMPAWLDLPLIFVARNAGEFAATVSQVFPKSGNVTLLERPLNRYTFLSAVEVALRSTAHQRAIGDLLEQRAQAVKLRDEFLAMLAHELRNPLAPMRNALYLMRNPKADSSVLQISIGVLERQLNHIVRMVDDLMDVARLERGKVLLKKQRTDLNHVVRSAVDMCLPIAQERGHRIRVDYHDDPLPVDVDADRIQQIICNLVHNSAKFTPAPSEIRVRISIEEKQAQIAVIDSGIGFHPGAAETLFDAFLQVNPTLERTASGLGIGLTIARRLCELHGGSIHATSEGAGKGACFFVRLPLVAAVSEPDSRVVPDKGNARSRRVAVIEDNPDIRETVGLLLRGWGHEVELAADGVSGVECVLKMQPDLALIDIGLPGMNGYEVARTIRERVPEADIKLVAVTGYGQPSDKEAARRAGFDDHLLKPVEPEVLERVVRDKEPTKH